MSVYAKITPSHKPKHIALLMNAAALHYTITPHPHSHTFIVHLHVVGSHLEGVCLSLPNWIAGSYMIRDFARHIVAIRAYDDAGAPVTLTPLTQYSWQSAAFTQGLNVEYEVFAHDPSVRTAFLNTDTDFFNATSVCLSIAEYAEQPHTLTLNPPAQFDQWQVATQLTRAEHTAEHGFGDYVAKNYDELADRPVRMGHLNWVKFEVFGIPHVVAISGEFQNLDMQRLSKDMISICAEQLRLFEPAIQTTGYAPFASYLFMLDVRGSGYGGLEHRDSTALLCTRDALPNSLDTENTRRPAYIELLGLISHEYFHSWNVKRIKPANFAPYDLTQITDTSLLWFFEGVTNYYDDLMLYRADILSHSQYTDILNRNIDNVFRHRAQQRQTVTEAGFYAWTKYYQPTENSINANTNYYVKGSLVALCIDLFIRDNSGDRFSLDDVMRQLWQDFGRDFYHTSQPRGVTLADIQAAIEQFAGTSANDLLYIALFTTRALPLNLLLLSQGLHLKYTRASSPELGAALKQTADGWLVERVLSGSMAEQVGLAPQDVLIALNRFKLDKKPDELLAQFPRQSYVSLHFWRDGALHQTALRNAVTRAQMGHFKIETAPHAFKLTAWPNALPTPASDAPV